MGFGLGSWLLISSRLVTGAFTSAWGHAGTFPPDLPLRACKTVSPKQALKT